MLAMVSNRPNGSNSDVYETMQLQPFGLVGDGAGPIFKIFTTAAALEMGMGIKRPARRRTGSRRQAAVAGAKGCRRDTWCAQNHNGSAYRSPMSVTDALATSPTPRSPS